MSPRLFILHPSLAHAEAVVLSSQTDDAFDSLKKTCADLVGAKRANLLLDVPGPLRNKAIVRNVHQLRDGDTLHVMVEEDGADFEPKQVQNNEREAKEERPATYAASTKNEVIYHNYPPVDSHIEPVGWSFHGFEHVDKIVEDGGVEICIGGDLDLDFIFQIQGNSQIHVLRSAAYMFVNFKEGNTPVHYSRGIDMKYRRTPCYEAAWNCRDSAYDIAASAYNHSPFARCADTEMVCLGGKWVTRKKMHV